MSWILKDSWIPKNSKFLGSHQPSNRTISGHPSTTTSGEWRTGRVPCVDLGTGHNLVPALKPSGSISWYPWLVVPYVLLKAIYSFPRKARHTLNFHLDCLAISQAISLNTSEVDFSIPCHLLLSKGWEKQAKGNLFEHVSVRLDQKFDLGRSRLGENVQDQLTGLLYFRTWPYRLDSIQNQITLWPQRDRATEDIWRAFGTKTFLGNIPALLLGLFLLFFPFKELEHSKLRLGLEIWNAPPTGIEGLGEKHSHYPSQTQSSDTDLPLKWGAKWMDLQRTAELCSPSKDHVPGS